ncbi:MAG: EAL domain-containing protein [Methylobacter sp.]
MIRTARLIAIFTFFAGLTVLPAYGVEPVKIGVLAYRPKLQTLAQWQPLAQALKQAMPERDFQVEAMTFPELDAAVASRQLDFVLTNAGHYVLLSRRSGLSAPLATLATDHKGKAVAVFGGVIFTREAQTDINKLNDLKGKSIAITGTDSLGGYQIQAYELKQAGLHLPHDARLVVTGMPHDSAVEAVLSGQADIGFVRTGVLENMAQEHKLDMVQIKILNRQDLTDYPYQSSTQLYPEWPIAALPHIDEHLARDVTAALFLLENNTKAAQAIHIHGFVVPADYTPVADLLKELRLPPFDTAPKFTLQDVLTRYRWQAFSAVLAGGFILLLSFRLLLTKQKLESAHRAVVQQKQQLQESERKYSNILESVDAHIYLKDTQGRYLFANRPVRELFGHTHEQIIGQTDENFFDAETVSQIRSNDRLVLNNRQILRTEETNLSLKDGKKSTYLSVKLPMMDESGTIYALCGISTDISERKQVEEKLQLAAKVFTHAREGIMITTADGTIVDVNDTFIAITGYQREETLGRNPRMFRSGRHSKDFYAGLWQDLINKGYWFGEIWNRRKNGEIYAFLLTISAVRDAEHNTQHYVALFSDITAIKEHEKQLEHIAHYDALTQLPNRVLLADRLRQAMAHAQRRGQRLAVVFLDLDGFKAINDNCGHEAGDHLLKSVATRMKQTLREGDTLARLGGDEFVAVLQDLDGIEVSVPMLTRLLNAAAQPTQAGEMTLQVSASLGVSFYPQAEDVDADQLLRQADQAMYQAKLAGKNRYHVFDDEQDRSVRGYHENLEHIRNALIAGEFVLYYQPKVNMRTGTVIGAEALIRWQHPDQGLLAPGQFLPAIENHPLSIELGEWVIDTALAQIESWRSEDVIIPVSVNVGALQLQQPDFIDRLRALLAAHPNITPGDLEIEVLETSALADLIKVSRLINVCKKLGIKFALDDFGTGYSSLTYLKHLPVSLLKIDQSFVRDMLDDPDDLAIVQGVLGLSNAFYRQVLAEGVETAEHSEMLLKLGCELAQGYGIARPMPAHELPGWAASWRPNQAWSELRQTREENMPILHAIVEHRTWVTFIGDYIKGDLDTPPPLGASQCRFGMRLSSNDLIDAIEPQAADDIASLHHKIHDLAAELCQLALNSRQTEAIMRLDELYTLRDSLIARLENLVNQAPKHT